MRLENLTWPKAQEYFEKNDMVPSSFAKPGVRAAQAAFGTFIQAPGPSAVPEHPTGTNRGKAGHQDQAEVFPQSRKRLTMPLCRCLREPAFP